MPFTRYATDSINTAVINNVLSKLAKISFLLQIQVPAFAGRLVLPIIRKINNMALLATTYIIFLFTNFSIIIILVLNVMAKRETGSALLHKTKQMPRINSNLETTIGLIIVAVFLFVIFTVPVLRDVPYLLTQN